jgi:hypothetical protein
MTDAAARPEPIALPTLPHTWRPFFGRCMGIAMAIVVLGGAILLAVALPGSGTVAYHNLDRAGIAALGLPIAVVLLLLARPRVTADTEGLTVVNLVRRRRVAWSEVVGIDLAVTASWASFDLDDGTSLPVLALQTVDGKRFRRGIAEVSALVAAHTRSGS